MVLEARRPSSVAPQIWYLQKSSLIKSLSLLRNGDENWARLNPQAPPVEKPDGQPPIIEEMLTHEALLQLMAGKEGEAVKPQNVGLWLQDFAELSRPIRSSRSDMEQRFVNLIRKTNPNSPALLPYFESLKN